MNYCIVADSSCELTESTKDDPRIRRVYFSIHEDKSESHEGHKRFFDIGELIKKMRLGGKMTTSCPSPGDYLEAFGSEEHVFVITISSKLSGSYNSAKLAAEMALAEDPSRKIHIFDSLTAAGGETLLMLKICECVDDGRSFEEVVGIVEEKIKEINTLFVLNSFENLIRNGRVSMIKGLLGSAFNFVPIMTATDGAITLKENVRGKKKSITRLLDVIGEMTTSMKDRILTIVHVNAADLATYLEEQLRARYSFKEIIICPAGELNSFYADEGGVIICF